MSKMLQPIILTMIASLIVTGFTYFITKKYTWSPDMCRTVISTGPAVSYPSYENYDVTEHGFPYRFFIQNGNFSCDDTGEVRNINKVNATAFLLDYGIYSAFTGIAIFTVRFIKRKATA